MRAAFHQTHSARHKPIANLSEQPVDEAAAALAEKVCRNARAHTADTVVFVGPNLDVTAIVETSSACIQAERERPHQVVGRWRRADALTLRRAIEAYAQRVGIKIR